MKGFKRFLRTTTPLRRGDFSHHMRVVNTPGADIPVTMSMSKELAFSMIGEEQAKRLEAATKEYHEARKEMTAANQG